MDKSPIEILKIQIKFWEERKKRGDTEVVSREYGKRVRTDINCVLNELRRELLRQEELAACGENPCKL